MSMQREESGNSSERSHDDVPVTPASRRQPEGRAKRKRADSLQPDENGVLKYICKYCNKRFDSSQGLGGHMKLHREARDKDNRLWAMQIIEEAGPGTLRNLYNELLTQIDSPLQQRAELRNQSWPSNSLQLNLQQHFPAMNVRPPTTFLAPQCMSAVQPSMNESITLHTNHSYVPSIPNMMGAINPNSSTSNNCITSKMSSINNAPGVSDNHGYFRNPTIISGLPVTQSSPEQRRALTNANVVISDQLTPQQGQQWGLQTAGCCQIPEPEPEYNDMPLDEGIESFDYLLDSSFDGF